MFLESTAHQACIYLIKNTVKILLESKTAVFYVNENTPNLKKITYNGVFNIRIFRGHRGFSVVRYQQEDRMGAGYEMQL